VPLVSGGSFVKWHLPHSIHGEHRGRTQKCPILNHRVEYHYSKIISVRIAIDRNGSLSECPIEFEVLQEFSSGNGNSSSRDEKITLGTVRLNLSEYVEESEGILRDGGVATAIKEASIPSGHRRKRTPQSINTTAEAQDTSPGSHASEAEEESPIAEVQDGVVRRYLMQDSKINSTLRISILMVQVDGERNYVAPAPKTAAVFGSIAGFVASDVFEPVDTGPKTPGHVPSSFTGKSRDVFELQDMYRRALAASWASQPGELPADQCIEDIFAGGEGFASPITSHHARGQSRHHHHHAGHAGHDRPGATNIGGNSPLDIRHDPRGDDNSGSVSDDEEEESGDVMGTIRPRDVARLSRRLHHHHHFREHSVASDRTVVVDRDRDPYRDRDRDLDRESSRSIGLFPSASHRDLLQALHHAHPHSHRREESRATAVGGEGGLRSRSDSLASLATTVGSERDNRGRDSGFKRAREVDEFEVREDLVAWSIPGAQL
jgi:hypothetical protein